MPEEPFRILVWVIVLAILVILALKLISAI